MPALRAEIEQNLNKIEQEYNKDFIVFLLTYSDFLYLCIQLSKIEE